MGLTGLGLDPLPHPSAGGGGLGDRLAFVARIAQQLQVLEAVIVTAHDVIDAAFARRNVAAAALAGVSVSLADLGSELRPVRREAGRSIRPGPCDPTVSVAWLQLRAPGHGAHLGCTGHQRA